MNLEKSDDDIASSIHIGPDIICENVENIQSKNYYSFICFKCHKKVNMNYSSI